MEMKLVLTLVAMALAESFPMAAQTPSADAPANPVANTSTNPASNPAGGGEPDTPSSERWNLSWQATSIGQHHGSFASPYEGQNSLAAHSESRVSLTTTLFLGLQLRRGLQLYFNPEIAGGEGFSGVTGVANATNGELPRVATATPKPYIARLYVTQDFGLGKATESFTGDANQLAGERPMTRYSITVGRFTVTDFFDNNRYSHDPRKQFMGWAIMYNGAWDYPADVRGYTWGFEHEFHTRHWTLRQASVAEPRVANGLRFDRRLFVNRGDMAEAEVRYSVGDHPGAARLLGFVNHANSGTYAEALDLAARTHTTPDVTATRHNGNRKAGAGLNVEQELTRDIGVFLRLGWNDGKTESFAFTAIDRLLNAGVSMTGQRWKRPTDSVATALIVSGVSGVHAVYLARGGLDFLIGDGRLTYGSERVWESYYSARVFRGLFATLGAQHIGNPGYNRDRGPLWVGSLRLHVEVDVRGLLPGKSNQH